MNYSPISESVFNFKLIAILPAFILFLSGREYIEAFNHSWLFLIVPLGFAIIWILVKWQTTTKVSYCTNSNRILIKRKNKTSEYGVDEILNYGALFDFAGRGIPAFTMYNIDFVDSSKKYVRFIVLEDNIEQVKNMGNLKYAITNVRHKRVKKTIRKR